MLRNEGARELGDRHYGPSGGRKGCIHAEPGQGVYKESEWQAHPNPARPKNYKSRARRNTYVSSFCSSQIYPLQVRIILIGRERGDYGAWIDEYINKDEMRQKTEHENNDHRSSAHS